VDLLEKVKAALEQYFQPDLLKLEDDDGISGYVVAQQFRGMSSLDRQTLIDQALRRSKEPLSREENRRVIAIAGLSPEEAIASGVS
jgi:acid stress-induced BolA-like protein IbaG/YrbA